MKRKLLTGLMTVMFILGMVLSAHASTLTSLVSMDNGYEIFISTSDSVAGTSFGAFNDWSTAHSNSTTLVTGTDYYLHVYGYDQGGPGGFLGMFTLTGTDHIFSNGGSTLYTNTTDWKGSNTGWADYDSLTDMGGNFPLGTGGNGNVWPTIADFPTDTHWVWAGHGYDNNYAYFSTKISATNTTPQVPEPATMLLFGLGLIGLAGARRRFKK